MEAFEIRRHKLEWGSLRHCLDAGSGNLAPAHGGIHPGGSSKYGILGALAALWLWRVNFPQTKMSEDLRENLLIIKQSSPKTLLTIFV